MAPRKPLGSHGSEQASPLQGRGGGRGWGNVHLPFLKTQGPFPGDWGLRTGGLELLWGCWDQVLSHRLGKMSID